MIVEYGPLLDVINVEVKPGYMLQLEFENGEERLFGMNPYLEKKGIPAATRFVPLCKCSHRRRDGLLAWRDRHIPDHAE